MTPLYQDPWFTFRFADDRIIPRFRLEGVAAGRRVTIVKEDPDTGERLGVMATAVVGGDGWVDVSPPLQVRAGEAFIVIPQPTVQQPLSSLCETCQHVREINTAKGSRFLLCQLSTTHSEYAKYPRQPMFQCAGYELKQQTA